MSRFWDKAKKFEEFKNVLAEEAEKIVESERFLATEVSVKSGPFTTTGVLYKTHFLNVLRQQFEMWEYDTCVMFRPGSNEMEKLKVNHSMKGRYVRLIYDMLREEVMKSKDRDVMWGETDTGERKSFVRYVQIFSNKTATTLKVLV